MRRPGAALTPPWEVADAPHDLVKEMTISLVVVTLLAVILAILFSSPDEKPSTIRQWSREDPIGFLKTAVSELARTSDTAEYGPPYNHNGKGQHAGFLRPQQWQGVSHPIDTAQDFVIGPVRTIPAPVLQDEISEFERADEGLKLDGIASMEKALKKATVNSDRSVAVSRGEFENVDNIMRALLRLAQDGGLEGDLLTSRQFFQTDDTKPLLFMSDGHVLEERGRRQHLIADQWGMMNETGSWPGESWLWAYTFWYQIEPFKSSPNVDLLVWLVMAALTVAFICVPLLPVLRTIPRLIPVHRVIWREHYRSLGA